MKLSFNRARVETN